MGRPSNAARDAAERARVLALVREKYSGTVAEQFGPTLAAEHLASKDGVHVHHDTLRRDRPQPARGAGGTGVVSAAVISVQRTARSR